MTKTDLDNRVAEALRLLIEKADYSYAGHRRNETAVPEAIDDIKSLILEVVEAVTPKEVHTSSRDKVEWGFNRAISEIKSKASELLG